MTATAGQGRSPHAPPSKALETLVGSARRRRARIRRGQVARLLVGAGGCGQAVGAGEVAAALRRVVAARATPVAVVEVGCTGMCYANVQVTLQQQRGHPDVTWERVDPDQCAALVEGAADRRPRTSMPAAFVWTMERTSDVPGLPQVPFLSGQRRVLLEHVGRMDPIDVDEALLRGVYRGLAHALTLPPAAVVDEIRRAELSGRGGAYFPTAVKWEVCGRAGGQPRYLVANAEEGEPGVFKDRHLLEGDPHRVVEGLLIAAYAIGAEQAFVYVNGLASVSWARITAALRQAEARGLVGRAILGSVFSCQVEVRQGAGGYVLGEETVLLESIEGRRAVPRIRPPHAVEVGLWGRPTTIQNVETLANVSLILERGSAWFVAQGTAHGAGTKLIAVTGDIARPGLVEVPIGTPMRHVLMALAGGVPGGLALQAILTGGPSGNFVPPDRLDAPLAPRHPDVLLGSGSLLALDETRDLLDAVRRLTRFNADESCGKCTPCREGVNRMWEILERATVGRARSGDRDDLLCLGDVAALASLCGLGKMAPNPVQSAIRHFRLPGLDSSPGAGP